MKKGITRLLSAVFAAMVVCSLPWGYVRGEAATQFAQVQAAYGQQSLVKQEPNYSVAPLSDEYVEYLVSGSETGVIPSTIDLSYLAEASYSASSIDFPSSYDLRTLGKTTGVKDQGEWGTCWAFSSLASVESNLVERYPLIDLSERHLAWFTYGGERSSEFFGPSDDPFNQGGTNYKALAMLSQWIGAASEETAPYTGDALPEELRYASDYHVQDAYYLPEPPLEAQDNRVDDAIIKEIIMEQGAVAVSYRVDWDTYNEETSAWYNSEVNWTNHAVSCIGWDDNYSKENFVEGNQPQNDGAWLIKNSWGVSWGDNGYFWLSYEDKTMAYGTFYQVESADNYQNLYQYDLTGWESSIGFDSTTAYASNVFQAERNEQLDAVSFYTTDAGTAYEISVYKGLADKTNPVSGTLSIIPQTGTEKYAGYHTIELPTPVSLAAGESFAVVIKLTNPNYVRPIAVEGYYALAGEESFPSLGEGGESFVSGDGVSWEDVYYEGQIDYDDVLYEYVISNTCIKAFTNPVRTVTFSEDSGPIAYGSTVKLMAPGAAIYYTTDGSEPTVNSLLYNSPLVIDRDMTIKAVAVSDGAIGTVQQRTYTQSSAYLSALTLDPVGMGASASIALHDNSVVYSHTLSNSTEEVRLLPLGSGHITINGEAVVSGIGSTLSNLQIGLNSVEIVSTDEGKLPVTYQIRLLRSPVSYDFEQETIHFDDQAYALNTREDFSGVDLHNGDSITPYIYSYIYLRDVDNTVWELIVPNRYQFGDFTIDFENEVTNFYLSRYTLYSESPDMRDAAFGNNEALALTPGEDLYFQRPAGNTYFASEIVRLEVPTRPAMPADVGIDYIKETTMEAIPSTVMVARNADLSDAWVGEEEPVAVFPGESLYLFYPATEASFCSLPFELIVDTRQAAPAQIPQIAEATDTRIVLEAVEGAEYRCGDGEWQSSHVFAGLTPDTSYTFAIRMAAQDGTFRSEERTVVLSTLSAESTQSTQSSVTTETTPDGTTGTTTATSTDRAPETTIASEAPNTGDSGVGSVSIMALLIAAAMIVMSKTRVK